MMESTRAITEMVLQEAKESAEDIIQEAKKSAEDTLENQRQLGAQRGNELAQSLLRKAQGEAEVDKLSSMANAKIRANWVILLEKEKMIANVLEVAKNKLRTLTESKEYIPILAKLIMEGGIILGEKELDVLLNEKDSTLSLKLEKITNEISEKTGFKTKIRLAEEKIKVIGGAMVRTINGKLIMDNTFDDILRRREKELRFEKQGVVQNRRAFKKRTG